MTRPVAAWLGIPLGFVSEQEYAPAATGTALASRESAGCTHCASRSGCLLAQAGALELRGLRASIRERRFDKGDVLTTEGERADMVYVVKLGSVFCYRQGLEGSLRPVGIAGRGSTFGLFGYLRQPNPVTGIATTAGRACGVPVSLLSVHARQQPALADQVHAALARNFSTLAAWSEGMRLQGVANQLAYTVLLLSQAQRSHVVELPAQTALAQLVGSTRETVARGLATLERSGGIRRLERRLCEVEPDALLAQLRRATAAANEPAPAPVADRQD